MLTAPRHQLLNLNDQPPFEIKETSDFLKMEAKIAGVCVSPEGWDGKEHGVSIFLDHDNLQTLGAHRNEQIKNLSRQLAHVINLFLKGECFAEAPHKAMHLQILFGENWIENECPSEASQH